MYLRKQFKRGVNLLVELMALLWNLMQILRYKHVVLIAAEIFFSPLGQSIFDTSVIMHVIFKHLSKLIDRCNERPSIRIESLMLVSQLFNRARIVKPDHFEPKRVPVLILDDASVHCEDITPVLYQLVLLSHINALKPTFETLPLHLNVQRVYKFKLFVHHGLTVVRPHVVPAIPSQIGCVTVQTHIHRMHIRYHNCARLNMLLHCL